MHIIKRLAATGLLLAGLLSACGGGVEIQNNATANPVNVPQSGSPTTNVPPSSEAPVATARSLIPTAAAEQAQATATAP